ncbi:hypothetical protein [Hymenobacter sp.]|jgi:hypothetical protein|uniref:hypothetical protein n=1 Tax=Hymenobacter sp. TaxID=1898978 RepID=UPI002EDABE52
MKYLFALLLLCLCACNHKKSEITSTATSPPISATSAKKVAANADPLADYMATYKGPVWRDRFNGEQYPLPDSIGGKPASFYLRNPKVSPLAKALYTSRFRPNDSDSTTQLLALATTDNSQIRPFYRWCLDFTISISDGALGEYPGEPALTYAIKFPQEFFAYMDKDSTGERYGRWVESIAYSGLRNYKATALAPQRTIASAMTRQCLACPAQTVGRINTFAKDVAGFAQNNQLYLND